MRRPNDLPPSGDRKQHYAKLLLVLAGIAAVVGMLAAWSEDSAVGPLLVAGVLFLGACVMYAGSRQG